MKINKPKHLNSMNDFEKKHSPVIEIISSKVIVKIGNGIEHPMNPEHFITWVELFLNGEHLERKELDSEDEPAATFELDSEPSPLDSITARSNCNIHGTWESVKKGSVYI